MESDDQQIFFFKNYVALAVFQPCRDLAAGNKQSLNS